MRIVSYNIFTVGDLKKSIDNLPNDMVVLADMPSKSVNPIVGFTTGKHDIGHGDEEMMFLAVKEWME